MNGNTVVDDTLGSLFKESPELLITKKDKIVIFSDLHMGNGGSTDDFLPNSALFDFVLKEYYLKDGFILTLNGDVEELQRFDWNSIYQKWKGVYAAFDRFAENDKLIKIVGNHDIGLVSKEMERYPYKILDGVKLNYKENKLFIFHGHQASKKYNLHNALVGYTLRYLANPLGIKNYSVSHSSRKKYKIEKNVYDFSSGNKIVSVIGHTHRPLFESLPKAERIKYKIEQLCRAYSDIEAPESNGIQKLIGIYKKELAKVYEEEKEFWHDNGLYNSLIHVPCLFNSGCVIGKRGITALEIVKGKISLVHWFDKKTSNRYLNHNGYYPEPIEGSDYFRMLINKEKLSYIFTRINLLA